MNKVRLKAKIVRSLRKQGFTIQDGKLAPPSEPEKEQIRQLHALAVMHQAEKYRAGLERHEDRLLQRIASSSTCPKSKRMACSGTTTFSHW